ncbi:hypothetical protein HN371_00500 [Candidatus Poribacteria bacterium]|jgi:hypothetical protein|nr:hypothetical protein [Candidatus Poribacteria bacterium]MBT7101171.1 hypothetical protein [Candidatus Poribacteria bacterium]
MTNLKNVDANLLTPSGVPYGVKHVGNKPRVNAMPYMWDIAEGNIANHWIARTFGHNSNVGTSLETVAHAGGLLNRLAAAQAVIVSCESAADSAGSAGAQSIMLSYLNASYSPKTTEVPTAGGSYVITTATDIFRINGARVSAVGADRQNAGEITIASAAGGNIIGTIAEGEGVDHTAAWTVPAGTTLYITAFTGSEDSSKGTEISFYMRTETGPWLSQLEGNLIDTFVWFNPSAPFVIPAKTEIEIRAKSNLGGADVTAGFEGWFEE